MARFKNDELRQPSGKKCHGEKQKAVPGDTFFFLITHFQVYHRALICFILHKFILLLGKNYRSSKRNQT